MRKPSIFKRKPAYADACQAGPHPIAIGFKGDPDNYRDNYRDGGLGKEV